MQLRNGYYSKEFIKNFTNAHNRLSKISPARQEIGNYITRNRRTEMYLTTLERFEP